MTFEELVVAVEHKLPVTFVVVNNACLGMVRQWQELFYGKRYAGSILSVKGRLANERLEQDLKYDYLPDFVKLAQAHGADAVRVIDPAKLEPYIYLLKLYPDAASRPWDVTQLLQQGYQRTGDTRLNVSG